MDASSISLGLAVLAGMASFLSPCVLSLVPAYIGYLGGRGVTASGANAVGGVQTASNRWLTFTHGLAFVSGFSFVFIFLGISAGLLGMVFGQASFQLNGVVYDLRDIVAKVGGLVVIVFGLHTMGVITIPFLEYDTRKQADISPNISYLSSAMMGVFFSAGWSPCVGPVLGALLTLALTAEGVGRAAWLLSGYSLGLAIPFLIAAFAIGEMTNVIRRYRKYTRYVSIATGAVLVIVGVLLLSGALQRLAGLGSFIDFGI
ncbi:MAG: cytochrome c biogenesis protein CcdA [Chloroflexi bacterium]|nr:cytochrome c biogenesis protein CcdA [Chloroflexota bacterium]